MNKKSFVIGMVMGIALTFIVFLIVGYFTHHQKDNSIQYLEKPVSYENKEVASFEVIQVIDQNAALAHEGGLYTLDATGKTRNTVVLLGSDFYSGQTVTLVNPQRVGSYSYTNRGGLPMTVPIIKGETCTDRREDTPDQIEEGEKQELFHSFDHPESYEGKKKASFKISRVLEGKALAREESDRYGNDVLYNGNTVLLMGEDYYDGQVIIIANPQKIGIFKHYGQTVPVIVGENK